MGNATSSKMSKSAMSSKQRKKLKRSVPAGRAYIIASFNNTLIYITDPEGNVLDWATAGQFFKGSKKSTPYAGQTAAQRVAKDVKDLHEMRSIEVILKGPGPARDAALRGLASVIKVTFIKEGTGLPFNGCREGKERRV